MEVSFDHQADVLLCLSNRRSERPSFHHFFRVFVSVEIVLSSEGVKGHLHSEGKIVRALLLDRKVKQANRPICVTVEHLHEVRGVFEVL